MALKRKNRKNRKKNQRNRNVRNMLMALGSATLAYIGVRKLRR
jgi:hypothetical protein